MDAKKKLFGLCLAFCFLLAAVYSFGSDQGLFNEDLLKNFTYRSLGPYRAGSWVTDFAVPESPPKAHLYTFYVATRNGGLWKTINNGTTFEPVFDGQTRLSIGDVALAPSNADIVWVGTGEAFNARSSYSGDGVYKSLDGGKTWKNMGLKDSHHIARICIHPENPDVVYIAAMGHLFSSNEERGVFKSEDGGQTWKKVLYINDKVGVIDLVMNPANPDILYAATYEKYRLPWTFEESGPESGIYKTTDGGKTWARLGGGLPTGKIGRIGIDIYLKNPDILYAVVENMNVRPSTQKEAEQDKRRGLQPQERPLGSELYRTDDAGNTWKKMSPLEVDLGGKAAYSFNQLRVDPNNDLNVLITGASMANSSDGGKTWHDLTWGDQIFCKNMFGDFRTLWIDPQNSDRIFVGSDGGFAISYDGGKTCDHYYNLPLGEFYAVGVDMEDPYNIYGGLQDHESWKGPSNGWSGMITLADWVTVGQGDGMYNQVDPFDSRWLYNNREFGHHFRVDQKLGTMTNIFPKREQGKPPYRFAWCNPIHLSPHNSQIIYLGAQVLLRSMNRGDNWQEISPDLTTNDAKKINGKGNIQFCTITTISESPLTPGVIWVGTDDGKVWLTKDYGVNWMDMTKKIATVGGPENLWVSRVFASNFKEGTAYVAKNGFRQDDFKPFLYKTTDFGATWTSISSNLPEYPINVIYEDKKNLDLLFLGNDIGVFVSIDGGKKWVRMKNNMPNVPVHDLLVHPRENDLVVGTYGRGLFVTNVAPMQELTEKVLAEDFYFFAVRPKAQRFDRTFGGNYHLYGDRHLATPNEPNEIVINYYLKNETKEKVKVTISDSYGKIIKTLDGTGKAGINRVTWDMSWQGAEKEFTREQAEGNPFIRFVKPGEYVIAIEIGATKLTQKARITKRAGWSVGPFPETISNQP